MSTVSSRPLHSALSFFSFRPCRQLGGSPKRGHAGRNDRVGFVRAELDVATVIIYGVVYGNIHATGSIQLKPGAHLVGNIVTPALVVEPGAAFDGSCRMCAVDWVQDEAAPSESTESDEKGSADVPEFATAVRSAA